MNLKNLKLNLPKTWQEVSRTGSENSVDIRIYHINPLSKIDPKRFQDQVTYSKDNPDVSITKLAIQAPGRGMRPLDDFKKGMEAAIASGIMPPEWTMQKFDELWKGITQSPHGERPGESDMANDIDIVQYQDEKTAWQALKNKALMQTQGFDVPIPGDITIPGMPKNATMSEVLQSDMLKKYVPKEQFEQLKKMQSVIKEVQAKMPEIKQDFEKKGVKYGEGKYLGYKTVYLEFPNPTPPPGTKSASSSSADVSGMGMGGKGAVGGGGHIAHLDPLPKVPEPYSAINTMYLGLLFKNFVIDGPLLWGIDHLPSGNTPCYSLTQTKEVVSTDIVEGKTFTGIVIVPLPSTFAREGYLYKEEVEEIYKNIISKLK